jgi:hypothetical protein
MARPTMKHPAQQSPQPTKPTKPATPTKPNDPPVEGGEDENSALRQCQKTGGRI